MSLTILSHNPRRPDEPMMTLITGQPNAAATVDQYEAMWSTRSSSPDPRPCNQADGRTVAETWATTSQMTPQATAGCAKRGRGASSVNRMGISRV